jgi:hypothetical protein
VLKRPELIRRLPAGSVPVIWGYERSHPFAEQCAQVAAAGFRFLVAPGDSTWLSTHGRLETARANIASATREGLRHGAHGLLLTHWGDQGHLQPLPLALPALVLTAQHAWEGEQTDADGWTRTLSHRLLDDATGGFADALAALGEIESCAALRQHNRSVLFRALFGETDEVRTLAEKITPAETAHIEEKLAQAEAHLDRAAPRCGDGRWLIDEARQAIRLTRLALERLTCARENRAGGDALQAGVQETLAAHERQWLRRNRPGGLAESKRYFSRVS